MFLCAHNQSRSVTAEGLLTGEKGYEVKSRALWKGFPRRITKHEGQWADEVYVMMPGMIPVAVEAGVNPKKIKSLWIPDNYIACEDTLLRELKAQLERHGIHIKKSLEKARADCYKVQEQKMGYLFKGWEAWRQPERPWWEAERAIELPSMREIADEDIEPVFEEEVSGHVTRPRDRFSYHDYIPATSGTQPQLRTQEAREMRDWNREADRLDRYVPVRGDESEEEIVERARKLWKFYDATDPKQKRIH